MRRDYPNTTLKLLPNPPKKKLVVSEGRESTLTYKKSLPAFTPADPLYWIAKGVLHSIVFTTINDNSITSNITSNGSAITILENDVMTRKIPSTFFFHA